MPYSSIYRRDLFRDHIVVVTGGYVGDDPPYQGHVAILDAQSGKLVHIWNSLCSDRPRLLVPSECPSRQSGIWGRAGAMIGRQLDLIAPHR